MLRYWWHWRRQASHFWTRTAFFLSSAGFKVHFANDAEGKKALYALPPHRFVIHNLGGGDVRYLYAEPQHCVCVFIGSKDAYTSYRAILSQPLEQADNVAPDYKTQAGALLTGDPVDITGQPPYAANISGIIIRRLRRRSAQHRRNMFCHKAAGPDAVVAKR